MTTQQLISRLRNDRYAPAGFKSDYRTSWNDAIDHVIEILVREQRSQPDSELDTDRRVKDALIDLDHEVTKPRPRFSIIEPNGDVTTTDDLTVALAAGEEAPQ